MKEPTETFDPPRLHCLRGLPAAPEISDDLMIVKGLPEAAKRQLFRALGPCLPEPVPKAVEAHLDAFCKEFEVRNSEIVRAIRACRFLLRNAAMTDLDVARFVEDLTRLGDSGEIKEILLPGFEAAKELVRAEMSRGAIVDHGKVVESVDWRVDQVTSSNRGDGLRLPVTLLTLGYREGRRQERITLQLPPEALRQLRAMCDRLL